MSEPSVARWSLLVAACPCLPRLLASRGPLLRERQAGQGLGSPACRASESRPGRPESAGVRSTSDRVHPPGPRPAPLVATPPMPASRRSRLRSKPLPILPQRRLGGGRKTFAVFKGVLASSGDRGRDDARGQRSGGAPGLTRTSGRSAGVPSRVRRTRHLRRRVLASARHYRVKGRAANDPKRKSKPANSQPQIGHSGGWRCDFCFRPVANIDGCRLLAKRRRS